jgi:carbon-monoxide dehydrogenase medium subunit
MVIFNRRMPTFDYLKPGSLPEALELLKDNDSSRYRVYAGGTDLMPKLKKRGINIPEAVVDLKGIRALDYIRYSEEEGLTIGALASVYDVAASPLVKEKYAALAQGAGSIGSVHIQNRATIVGNICSASPSADSAPALLCLGAQVRCISQAGERTVALEDFFAGPNQNTLLPGEVVAGIRVPPVKPGMQSIYFKLSPRERMDLALVGVAVVGHVNDNQVQDIRISMGGVSPTPMRARLAEAELAGGVFDANAIERAAQLAGGESCPSTRRASAEYRCMMAEVLVKRGLQRLLSQIR